MGPYPLRRRFGSRITNSDFIHVTIKIADGENPIVHASHVRRRSGCEWPVIDEHCRRACAVEGDLQLVPGI
jgi:hypothetical protein